MLNKRSFPFAFTSLTAAVLIGSLAACSGGGGTGGGITPAAPASNAPLTQSTTQSDTYSAAVLSDTPTAYYRLDDGGTSVADSSGNALSGTIGSYVTTSSDGLLSTSSDTAMTFHGENNSAGVIRVAQTSKLQPSKIVSLEALLRFSATPATYTVPVAYGTDSGYAPYDLYFENGRIYAQFDLTSGPLVVKSPSALLSNTTYHIVSTFDGSTGRLYINGTQVASVSKNGTLTGYAHGYGLAIGDDAGYTDPAFSGVIDEVAVYAGKALSATRVAAHYAAATTGSATPAPTVSPVSTASATPAPAASATAAPTIQPTAAPTVAPTIAPTAAPVSGTSYVYHGCQVYPAGDTYVNNDISNAAVSPNSAAITSNWSGMGNFDYGDTANSEEVNLATNSTPLETVQYAGGHNPPMTNGAGTQVPWQNGYDIEGTYGQNSDAHSQVLNTQTCEESEMYGTTWNGSSLGAYGGMNVNLGSSYSSQYSKMGPITVAYVPIFGFTDFGEDASLTSIDHPLSFFSPATSAKISKYGYYAPSHNGYVSIGSCTSGNNCLHLGDYIRLKASFDCSPYTRIGQLVCNQLKHYGAVYDDDAYHLGFRFGLSTDGSNPWNYSVNLQPLFKALTMQNFDIIEHGSLQCSGSPCV